MGWQWHQLDHMQIICTLLQTDNHASTSQLSFNRPDALPDTQSTEGNKSINYLFWQKYLMVYRECKMPLPTTVIINNNTIKQWNLTKLIFNKTDTN